LRWGESGRALLEFGESLGRGGNSIQEENSEGVRKGRDRKKGQRPREEKTQSKGRDGLVLKKDPKWETTELLWGSFSWRRKTGMGGKGSITI